ncbi:MAG: PepSY-associated TM helix domain-containing protein [Pseudomonadota bacterium]
MISLDQARTKRMVAIHGWSGVVLGLLLYVVVLTGAVAVFDNEIGRWSKGVGSGNPQITSLVHRAVSERAAALDPSFHEEIVVTATDERVVRMSFQRHERHPETGNMTDYAEMYFVDPATGETVEHKSGYLVDLFVRDQEDALKRFLVDLHIRLHVPGNLGLYLTGILGLVMLVAAVSGLVMHRHLIRDLFTASRAQGRLSDRRDRHVLAAAWGLPFSILLAFTGAFFSFAISLGVPIVAMVAFGGDQEALIATVIGPPEAQSEVVPARLASLDYIVLESGKIAGAPPISMAIEGYGTSEASVTTTHGFADGNLTSTTLMWDGVSRAFLGEKPILGLEPSAGSAVVSLMAPLHFGNFGGLVSRTVWLAMGLAMAFVIGTGMQMWVHRREADRLWRRFGVAVEITLWGLPFALLTSAVAFFIALQFSDTLWWTPAGFLIGCAMAIVLGLKARDPGDVLRPWVGALCLGLPVLRHLMGGTSWSEALLRGDVSVLTIDILLLIGGVWLLRLYEWLDRERLRPFAEPAE